MEDTTPNNEPEIAETEEPPLHRAARLGDVQEVARLVSTGADINERSTAPFQGSLNPLMVAASSTDAETKQVIEWLLTHGADPTLTSEHVVERLLTYDADPILTSEVGGTAAWYAAGSTGPDSVERLKLLLDAGLNPNEKAGNGQSLLFLAFRLGDPERVRLLLDRGATLSLHGVSGTRESWEIPLFMAASSGSIECVKLLLDAGADIHERTKAPEMQKVPGYENPVQGYTVLSNAASPEIAQLLIAAGADVNSCDWYTDVLGKIFLRADDEATMGNLDLFAVADVLLEAGASLDTSPQRHYGTRLYYAALSHQAHVLDYLLQRGASRESNSEESTPLHAICWQGEYEGDEEKTEACERIIRTLVGAGFSMDARDNEGRTPLHMAAGGDWANYTAARVLLELGAEPNPVDMYGQTPLHLAASRKAKECTLVLLAAGADPTHKDNEGWTPIDYAEGVVQTWTDYAAFDEATAEVNAKDLEAYRKLKRYALEGDLAKAQAILKTLQEATSNS